jgi:hypothetical protein
MLILQEIARAEAMIDLLEPSSNRDYCEMLMWQTCIRNIKKIMEESE